MDEWLSSEQAARRLGGVAVATLHRWLEAGELPFYQKGNSFRLRQSDVDAYIEAHRVRPGSLRHLYPPPVGAERP